MTSDSDRLRATFARLTLTQTRAAALLGVGDRTLRGWCQPDGSPGARQVPVPIWRLLDLLEHVPGVVERLGEMAQEPRPPRVSR